MMDAGMPVGTLLGTLNPSCPNLKTKRENNLHFYFHTLWWLKKFYKGL